MKHTVFALFENDKQAEAAIDLLSRKEGLKDSISVLVHRHAVSEEQLEEAVQHSGDPEEMDTRHSVAGGIPLGAAVGAVVGALIAGPFGLLGGGPLAGAVFGAAAGTMHGALASALVGSGLPDHALHRLAGRLHEGCVLVTVHTPDKATEERVESLFRRHGAEVAEKQVV